MSREAFYSTAAQVIPVIWIILVFQLKAFGDKIDKHGAGSVTPENSHRRAPVWFLIFLVLQGVLLWMAELAALGALMEISDGAFSRGLVHVALFSGLSTVFYTPVAPWFEALVERVRGQHRDR